MVLFFLSKSNPLRWASIWFWGQASCAGIYTVTLLHVGASFVSLAPIFHKNQSALTMPLRRYQLFAGSSPYQTFETASFSQALFMPEQALYRLLRLFCKSQSALMPLLLLSAKSHARLPCSVVNALATVRCRYQLFAGSNPHHHFTLASFLLPVDKLPQG